MDTARLRAIQAAVTRVEWSQYNGTIFGAHVGDDCGDHEDGIPCRITTGGFDDEEAAELAVAAVNSLPLLLDIADAARPVLNWHDTTHGNEFGHDHHCPEQNPSGLEALTPGDPDRCTCGWALAMPALDALRAALRRLEEA